ncbi:choice-of-anchor X domain-containing protein [uncultured Roseobacter sp.]|uniref:choice-of-anchor X domain-containing protein n=1 Tax=uncultured Roseobacter sp. TaxID=114847 RepID=UPI002623F272|nr:choice-of-anchor X domain-containing protein [uncultured Roseobacter sp.]
MTNLGFSALILGAFGLAGAAMAQDMAVGDTAVSGSAAGGVTLSAAPLHAMGPEAISLVAFELTNASGTWSLPPANDGGTQGDAIAGDGVWSMSTVLPNADPGAYEMKVYVVDTTGSEFVSDPVDVTLN